MALSTETGVKKGKRKGNQTTWWHDVLSEAASKNKKTCPDQQPILTLLRPNESAFKTPDIEGVQVLLQTKDSALWCVPRFDVTHRLSDFKGLSLVSRPPVRIFGGVGHAHRDVAYHSVSDLKASMSHTDGELKSERSTHQIYESVRQPLPAAVGDLDDASLHAYQSLVNVIDNVASVIKVPLDGCYINYYRDGADCIGAHADKEVEPNTPVVAVAFGATRTFRIRDKTSGAIVLDVPHTSGMLLVMDGAFQAHFKHEVPPQKRIRSPRLSITLRQHTLPIHS